MWIAYILLGISFIFIVLAFINIFKAEKRMKETREIIGKIEQMRKEREEFNEQKCKKMG